MEGFGLAKREVDIVSVFMAALFIQGATRLRVPEKVTQDILCLLQGIRDKFEGWTKDTKLSTNIEKKWRCLQEF